MNKLGDKLHRGVYYIIALLPYPTQNIIHNYIYSKNHKKWNLAGDKSRSKRIEVIKHINKNSNIIVEYGCGDGSVLVFMSESPELVKVKKIIGVDSSSKALHDSYSITRKYDKISTSSVSNLNNLLQNEKIDTLILSEVLYYFGSLNSIKKTLKPILEKMSESGEIILVHGSSDARQLHEKASKALKIHSYKEIEVYTKENPYLITLCTVK